MLEWREIDPLQVTKSLNLPLFTLQDFSVHSGASRTNTGEYGFLDARFLFQREMSYYLLQCYIPCTMFVLISFLQFWLNLRDFLARIIISLLSLISLTIFVTLLNLYMPPVSYIKAIDVWTGVCLTFTFASLIELIVVAYLYRHRSKTCSFKEDEDLSGEHQQLDSKESDKMQTRNRYEERWTGNSLWNRFQRRLEQNEANKVDVICRALFPLKFVLFVFIYGMVYLCRQ